MFDQEAMMIARVVRDVVKGREQYECARSAHKADVIAACLLVRDYPRSPGMVVDEFSVLQAIGMVLMEDHITDLEIEIGGDSYFDLLADYTQVSPIGMLCFAD